MNGLQRIVLQALGLREYLPGPAAVSLTAEAMGMDSDEWAPSEYGDYIAKSNHIYTVISRRAELLARLPLRVYQREADGDDTEVMAGPLYDLLDRPNDKYDGTWLTEMTQMDMDLWGRAFWILSRGPSGRGPIREMWRVKPTQMTVVPSRTDYIAGYMMKGADGGEDIPWSVDEVVYFRYPNPIDELAGLSPMAAARLAADLGTSAMLSNYMVFKQGTMASGAMMPAEGGTWTKDQADQLERSFARRMSGVDKAHRWAVFRQKVELHPVGFSPKDAEHLETMRWSLEEVARAYRFPLDLLRGETTYENQDAAMRSVYTHGVIPAGWRYAQTLNNTVVRAFDQSGRTTVGFDASQVEVLQENRAEIVDQITKLAAVGVPLNKLLGEFAPQLLPEDGDGYAWGDVAWLNMAMVPVDSPEIKVAPPGKVLAPEAIDETPPVEEPRSYQRREFGDADHRAVWQRLVDDTEPHERRFATVVRSLLTAQRDSVLAKLDAQRAHKRALEVDDLWDDAEWTRKARERAKPGLREVIRAGMKVVGEQLGDPGWVGHAAAERFLARRTQRFAEEVNATTWDALKASLNDGIREGEGIRDLKKRVSEVMDDRIASSAETIARTEVVGAYNGGGYVAAQELGADEKTWYTALDSNVRDSHAAMHDTTIGIREDFDLDGGSGPCPGQIGAAEEDINCRCVLLYG